MVTKPRKDGSSRLVPLSRDGLNTLFDNLESGNIQEIRSQLQSQFKMNDILAEASLTHLQKGLKEKAFKSSIFRMLDEPLEIQQSKKLLSKIFGLYDRAAEGILQNIGITGNSPFNIDGKK